MIGWKTEGDAPAGAGPSFGGIVPALVMGLAVALRWWSLDFGLPDWMARPDEANITSRVQVMLRGGHWSPGFFEYPALFLYLLRALFALGVPGGSAADYIDDPGPWLLVSRTVSAAAGVATVALTARLGSRLGRDDVPLGWIAALLLAVAPLHVRDSHFGTTDVLGTCLVVAALLAVEELRRRPGLVRALAVGMWVGLAGATKYNLALVGVAMVPVVLADRSLGWGRRTNLLLAAAAVAIATFLAINPYVFLDSSRFFEDFAFQAAHLRDGHGVDLGVGWGYHLTDSLRYGLTGPVLLLGLIGVPVVFADRGNRARWLPLLVFSGIFYASLGPSRTVFFRYAMPVMPGLALLAACSLVRLATAIAPIWAFARGAAPTLALALAVFAATPGAISSVHLDRLLGKRDTREQAREWLEEHVGPGEGVIFAGGQGAIYGEPRIPGREWCQILAIEMEPSHCGHVGPFEMLRLADPRGGLSGIDRARFRWVVTHEHALARYSALHFKLAAALERDATPVVSFVPYQPGVGGVFDPSDAFYAPLRELSGHERPGPVITVWRLDVRGSVESPRNSGRPPA